MGDQGTVYQHVQRFARKPVQFDNRALVQLQQVPYRDLGVAHFHGNGDRYIENDVDIRSRTTTHGGFASGLEFLHGRSLNIVFGLSGLAGLCHRSGPLVLAFALITGLFHGGFPLGSQLFVFAELLLVFLVVVSHCVPPSIVSLPWALMPAHESAVPVSRHGSPELPCKRGCRWR